MAVDPVLEGSLLVALDGKPHSSPALDYAVSMAKLTSSRLFGLCVVNPKNEQERQASTTAGMATLEEAKKVAASKGVELTVLLEAGTPNRTILSAAERVKATTIIVGTSGKTALDRVIIGSVSEHVVRNSPVTVIVVR